VWNVAAAAADACIEQVLATASRRLARANDLREYKASLTGCDLQTDDGQRTATCLCTCACGPFSAFMQAVPTTPRLTSQDLWCAVRLSVGVKAVPWKAPGARCACGFNLQRGNRDHAMMCTRNAGVAAMRHSILLGAWRRATFHAGVLYLAEPVLLPLQGG
jgi:hypothetical protein